VEQYQEHVPGSWRHLALVLDLARPGVHGFSEGDSPAEMTGPNALVVNGCRQPPVPTSLAVERDGNAVDEKFDACVAQRSIHRLSFPEPIMFT
jgi:hypothetical protein